MRSFSCHTLRHSLPWLLLAAVGLWGGSATAQDAVSEPLAPPSALEQALDSEISRIEAHGRALDRAALELRQADETEQSRYEAQSARAAELDGQLRISEKGSAAVFELYRATVDELKRVRPALRSALDRLRHATSVPSFEPGFESAGLDLPALQQRRERLQALQRETRSKRMALSQEEEELRRASVERWGALTERLNALRIEAIAGLPDARRSHVLGIGREGIDQLRREVEQFVLSARLYLARRAMFVDRLPGRVRDVFALGTATWTVFKLLLSIVVYTSLRRRGARIRSAAYRWLREAAGTARGRRRGELLVQLAEAIAPWGSFLLFIVAVRWSLADAVLRPQIEPVLAIATLFGFYRLAIDVLFAVSLRVARRYRLILDARATSDVLRSVRTMMRVLFGILVLLTISEGAVGRGYLYHLIARFAWTLVVAAAILLLARWRRPIADAYLAREEGGRLAALVKHSRDRWYGVFVGGAAFVLLAGRASLEVGRDFALGFEQTRRALAFMFRRRVEKRAEQSGYADGNVEELPASVVEAFAESPVQETTPAIDDYPGLDRLDAMIAPWLERDIGSSFLLTGEKGMGKTSWLGQLGRFESDSVPFHYICPDGRLLSEARLVACLAEGLELALEPGAGMRALREALVAGPKRIVAFDHGQNLFLGKVGGYDSFERFVSLVEATCDRIFWVCSISAFAWDHLRAVRPDLVVFRDHQALEPWPEEKLGKMLRKRTAAAGIRVSYDDLLLDIRVRRDPSRQMETAEQYTRLLWDYSDGNPRAALHFWLRSLVPVDERNFRVRLFRAPTVADLDGLGERSRFLLAAIVVHENLSLLEAAEVTRYPTATCRLLLQRFLDQGMLQRSHGQYRLTTHWHRTVVRFLKRGNLIAD